MRCMGRMGFGRGDVRARGGARRRPVARLTGRRLRLLLVVGLLAFAVPATSATSAEPRDRSLYLVTLDGPGQAGYARPAARAGSTGRCCSRTQDAVLDLVGVDDPVYQWTDRAERVRRRAHARPGRAAARRRARGAGGEERVRPLAGCPRCRGRARPDARRSAVAPARWSDWSTPASGRRARCSRAVQRARALGGATSDGECAVGDGWARRRLQPQAGRRPLVRRRLRRGQRAQLLVPVAARRQRARHPDGVHRRRQRRGVRAGAGPAPRAGTAASHRRPGSRSTRPAGRAPDPADDGCATADLVTAIDRATSDGVDVLNLSVGGPSTVDTVERALLGAAEEDVVVVAAAGNRGRVGVRRAPVAVGDVGRRHDRRRPSRQRRPRRAAAELTGAMTVGPRSRPGQAGARRARCRPPAPRGLRPGSAAGLARRVPHRGHGSCSASAAASAGS